MNRNRIVYVISMYFFIIISLLGCSQKTQVEEKPGIKLMLKMEPAFKSDNNLYIKELENITNMRLEIDVPSPSSYNERLNVVMASGTMPDIVQLNWSGEGNLPLWARNGMIKPIDLAKTKNIELNIPKSLLTMLKVTGDEQVYGVPGLTSSDYYGAVIRQDWLDKLKLDQPSTLEEYTAVLKAFTNGDPDGNGRADTVGITSWRLNHFGGIFGGAFKMDYLWNSLHTDPKEGKSVVRLREEQQGYMDFMDFAKKAYEDNILDKDFTSLQSAEDKFILGKVGMTGAYSRDTIKLEKELQKFVPDARLEWILCPRDPEGRIWNFNPESYGYTGVGSLIGNNAVFLITKDADYDNSLYFLDMMNSKEMILLSNLGIQGIHYDKYDENRKILVRTESQNQAAKQELFGISDTYRGEVHAYLGDSEEENQRLDYYWKKGNLLITNPICFNMGQVPENAKFQQMNPLFKEKERVMALKYVVGTATREEYLNYLNKENIQTRKQLTQDADNRYRQLMELTN